jgi:hypothetical protein
MSQRKKENNVFLLHQHINSMQYGFKTSLKKVPDQTVPPVVALGVNTIEMAHPFGQIAFGSFDHQVIIIIHQAIGMAKPAITRNDKGQNFQKALTVVVIRIDRTAAIATRSDMIDSSRIFN